MVPLITTLTLMVSLIAALPVTINPRGVSQIFQHSRSDYSDLTRGAVGRDSYRSYSGDGSAVSGWPDMDEWVSFQRMFDSNAELMKNACTDVWGLPTGSDTSDEEIGLIWNAIQSTARDTGVDHRFILAVMMQESGGCVRIWTTWGSHGNPGLMQDFSGSHSCNWGAPGETSGLVNPCPADQITGMIDDGVGGTAAGDGLAGLLNGAVSQGGSQLDGSSAQLYYQAARAYNSGQFDANDLNFKFSSTRCYAMDIANRLTGWVTAPKQCSE